jgi:multimeric flavodoxin WrbA
MRIMVLNGSPRRSGTVAALLKAVTEGLPPGRDVAWVDVCGLNMAFCTACMSCRSGAGCALPTDDAHRVGERIRVADALVIGTPTHWGNVCAPLKLLFDRNVPVFMGEGPRGFPVPRQKGKRAVIVTACSTPWPLDVVLAECRGAVRAVREVLHYGGYRLVGTLTHPGTRSGRPVPERVLARARRLGGRL